MEGGKVITEQYSYVSSTGCFREAKKAYSMFLITIDVAPVSQFRFRKIGSLISFTVAFDVQPKYPKAGCTKRPFIEFKGEASRENFNQIERAVRRNQVAFKDEIDARDAAYQTLPLRETDEFDMELWQAERSLYQHLPLSAAGLKLDSRISELIWQNQD